MSIYYIHNIFFKDLIKYTYLKYSFYFLKKELIIFVKNIFSDI